ncbi:DUF2254 family protein [Oligoflexus sp.]|uniref:DUF2254 family protein n=1 Tax=Oligoflexus sp. TaxID=1971216 RepID=UPI0039C9E916
MVSLATQHDVVIEIRARPGGFIAHADDIVHVSGKNSHRETFARDINHCFSLGTQRTMEQDLEFGFQMLVEMSVRALSPSMNDPFTALQCIDYLRESFKTMMQMPRPNPLHRDSEGSVRVIQPFISVTDLLTNTLSPLHHYARHAPMVLNGLNNMLDSLTANAGSPEILNHSNVEKNMTGEGREPVMSNHVLRSAFYYQVLHRKVMQKVCRICDWQGQRVTRKMIKTEPSNFDPCDHFLTKFEDPYTPDLCSSPPSRQRM